jgi:hypothetical protein
MKYSPWIAQIQQPYAPLIPLHRSLGNFRSARRRGGSKELAGGGGGHCGLHLRGPGWCAGGCIAAQHLSTPAMAPSGDCKLVLPCSLPPGERLCDTDVICCAARALKAVCWLHSRGAMPGVAWMQGGHAAAALLRPPLAWLQGAWLQECPLGASQ